MTEEERKNIKGLSCKLVKQINERQNAESKLNLMKSEKENLEYQQEESRKTILELEKKAKKTQLEMDTLWRQNEYKVYLADSVEKDRRILE